MDKTTEELIRKLIEERDREYLRAEAAEARVAKLSNAAEMESDYESKLRQKDALIRELDGKMARLQAQLEYLKRKVWGSMSEKRRVPDDPRQLSLDFAEETLTDVESEELSAAQQEIVKYRNERSRTASPQRHPARTKLPDSLRREYVHIYPEGYHGHEDEWILFNDTEEYEQVEYKPAELYVRVTVRHKGRRRNSDEIITAPKSAAPIDKSYASASLLAELMANKYERHLPFYRQIDMFRSSGLELKEPTVIGWFHEVADLLRPLYHLQKGRVLSCDYVQADETVVPVEVKGKNRTVKGYLWAVRDPMTGREFFHYDHGSRSSTVAYEIFKDYKGALQTDNFAGYNIVLKRQGILALGCMAHTRRHLDRAMTNDRTRASFGLELISMVYSVEDMADSKGLSHEERAALRQKLAHPVMQSLEKWALAEYPKVLPKSPIGKALHYIISNARELDHYVLDGRYCIDNNPIERSIRPITLGRKNFLFCGNHEAAEDTAIIYTFMCSCRAIGIEFKEWLRFFLEHVHDYDNDYGLDLGELLPDRMSVASV